MKNDQSEIFVNFGWWWLASACQIQGYFLGFQVLPKFRLFLLVEFQWWLNLYLIDPISQNVSLDISHVVPWGVYEPVLRLWLTKSLQRKISTSNNSPMSKLQKSLIQFVNLLLIDYFIVVAITHPTVRRTRFTDRLPAIVNDGLNENERQIELP